MSANINRRMFVVGVGAAICLPSAAVALPDLSAGMAYSMRAMSDALTMLAHADKQRRSDWTRYEAAGLLDSDGFWGWYKAQPSTRVYDIAVQDAQGAVESAFMTTPQTLQDEEAVMAAFEAYRHVGPSAFAVQTARDLFTPRRYLTYSLEGIRYGLLNDPEEDFVKSGMPDFLRVLRQKHAAMTIR